MSRIFGEMSQICWVVPDIDAAIRYWGETLGVGPWSLTRHVEVTGFEHAGEPSDVDMSLAIAYSGDMQIELIEQHNQAPSLYHDVAPGPRGGQHHVGYYALDYEERRKRILEAGYEIGQQGAIGSIHFTYFRTAELLGTYSELISLTDEIAAALEGLKAAARGWDGRELLVPSFA